MPATHLSDYLNHKLPLNDRVRDLLARLTLDEKISLIPQYQAGIDRLGIKPYKHGTEAAHGIAWLGEATFFPQPLGLSSTWNCELMREIGNAISDEARVFYRRDPENNGLTLWAPTVDLARDPRWGRTEETYGEDPCLAGGIAAGYVKGIQGSHPVYMKAVATLKHFFASNNELNRGSCSVNVNPRNLWEYYLKPYEMAFSGGAQSLMTAYNAINGVPAIVHPALLDIIKARWMDGFIVSDAWAMVGLVEAHKYCSTLAEAAALTLKAGVDSITDATPTVIEAVKEALKQSLLCESEIDRALFNTLRVRFRLGEFDPPEQMPYSVIDETRFMTEEHRHLSLRAARESIVMLKNSRGLLPLNPAAGQRIALIGPLGDSVFRDHYSGTLPYKITVKDAMAAKLDGSGFSFEEGVDHIRLRCITNPSYTAVRKEDKQLALTGSEADAAIFKHNDWGWGKHTLREVHTGKYVTSDDQTLHAVADEAFGYFVKELFSLAPNEQGDVQIRTWNKHVSVDDTNRFLLTDSGEPLEFALDIVKDGVEAAVEAAKAADIVVMCVGHSPVINGKEMTDRPGLELAGPQEQLVKAVYAANPNIVLVLTGGYPFAIPWIDEHISAILSTTHMGPEHGQAIADVLFGDYNPAGRLSMTWYRSEAELTDIMDYDIIASQRTYQYFEGNPLYCFGHGGSYSTFAYSRLCLNQIDRDGSPSIEISGRVKNTSAIAGEEVIQLYVHKDSLRIKHPLKKLHGFKRISLQPGEEQQVRFSIPVSELRVWDVSRGRFCLETGTYTFMLGGSSADIKLSTQLTLQGETIPPRNPEKDTSAMNYDSCDSINLIEVPGGEGYVTASVDRGWIAFYCMQSARAYRQFAAIAACTDTDCSGTVELRLGSADGRLAGRLQLGGAGEAMEIRTCEFLVEGPWIRGRIFILSYKAVSGLAVFGSNE